MLTYLMVLEDLRADIADGVADHGRTDNLKVGIAVNGATLALGIVIYGLFSGIFAGLGVLIALLGVWGLVSFFR